MNANAQVERGQVLRQLEQQRERINALFDKSDASSNGRTGERSHFPRSHTMHLVLSEPMLAAGLSALAARILGLRALKLFTVLASAFRVARSMSSQ